MEERIDMKYKFKGQSSVELNQCYKLSIGRTTEISALTLQQFLAGIHKNNIKDVTAIVTKKLKEYLAKISLKSSKNKFTGVFREVLLLKDEDILEFIKNNVNIL